MSVVFDYAIDTNKELKEKRIYCDFIAMYQLKASLLWYPDDEAEFQNEYCIDSGSEVIKDMYEKLHKKYGNNNNIG